MINYIKLFFLNRKRRKLYLKLSRLLNENKYKEYADSLNEIDEIDRQIRGFNN